MPPCCSKQLLLPKTFFIGESLASKNLLKMRKNISSTLKF